MSVDEGQKRTFLAPVKAARTSPSGEDLPRPACELPPDLLLEASKRLQVLALLLASTLFLANFLGHLLDLLVGDIEFFQDFSNWAPGAVTILLSLLVYVVVRSHAIAPAKLMDVGLVFGAVSSFGIATSEFWGAYSEVAYRDSDFFGLSWVAVWMLCYTVIIPNRPAKTLLSLMVSASSVSIVIGLSVKYAGTVIPVGPGPFFFGTIFPYLVCTGMAYVGARVVYRLGTAVSRARELGSYRLIDILGSGGMGEVWRAQHRMLARPAAIKLIRPEALAESNSEDRKTVQGRFEREAQATASLRSPHTIELYDSLGEAHAAGLVHRDIKPSNVYVCRYGRAVDFVKILDFGLVKPHDAEGEQLTADHVVSGSPAFMAPEQVLGDREIDGRSDLYAVGCVAYWLLTGQYVFDAANPIQTMVQHAQSTPVPPSKCCELPIPQALDEVVMACLEKDPANRPQSADALADALAGVSINGSWTQERARQWWDQHHPAGG